MGVGVGGRPRLNAPPTPAHIAGATRADPPHRSAGGGLSRFADRPHDLARSRRLHRHGLVVGRAGRRHQALGQDRDRRVLHPLRGQARGVCEEIRLQGRRALRGDSCRSGHRGDRQHHAERRAPADHACRGRGRQARLPRQADRQHRQRRPRHHRNLPQGRRDPGNGLSAPPREPFPLGQAADRRRHVRHAGQRRSQHQPRPARQDRPVVVALSGRRHAGRRDAADRHPLRRRADLSDGAGEGGARASSLSSCCPATTRTSRA